MFNAGHRITVRGPVPMKGGLGALNPCDPFVSFPDNPLATGFSLYSGQVTVTVPNVPTGSKYAIVRTYPLPTLIRLVSPSCSLTRFSHSVLGSNFGAVGQEFEIIA